MTPFSERDLYEYRGETHHCKCGVMIGTWRDECSRCKKKREAKKLTVDDIVSAMKHESEWEN